MKPSCEFVINWECLWKKLLSGNNNYTQVLYILLTSYKHEQNNYKGLSEKCPEEINFLESFPGYGSRVRGSPGSFPLLAKKSQLLMGGGVGGWMLETESRTFCILGSWVIALPSEGYQSSAMESTLTRCGHYLRWPNILPDESKQKLCGGRGHLLPHMTTPVLSSPLPAPLLFCAQPLRLLYPFLSALPSPSSRSVTPSCLSFSCSIQLSLLHYLSAPCRARSLSPLYRA